MSSLKNNPYNAIVSLVEHEAKDNLPLSGWTVALKDNINMKDTLTTASSEMLSNYTSVYDATITKRLLDHGAKIVAKTSMDELGMGGTNRNALTGPVLNPYDETRISGGSSGGSAALSGARLVRLAIGTDTGDSIRKPASYCGSVGLKPSYGRLSRYGVVPYSASLDHVGFFAENVEDAAYALEVLSGIDPLDMTSLEAHSDYTKDLDIDLKGKKIAVFKNVIDVVENESIKAAFNNFVEDLKAQGAIIIEKEMDQDLMRAMLGTYLVIANGEAVTHHASFDGVRYGKAKEGASLEEIMVNTRTSGFSTFVKERLIYGQYSIEKLHNERVFQKAKKVRRLLVESYHKMLEDVDVVIAPATPTPAPKLDHAGYDITADSYLIGENHMVLQNFSGYPSITLPLGKEGHLPFGLNVSAKGLEDHLLLQFAKAFENLIDWKGDF